MGSFSKALNALHVVGPFDFGPALPSPAAVQLQHPCPTHCRTPPASGLSSSLSSSLPRLLPFAGPRPSSSPFFLARRACTGQCWPRRSRSGRRPVAARRAGRARPAGGSDSGGQARPAHPASRPARRPMSQAVENALRTGVLALSPAQGRRPAVRVRTHEVRGGSACGGSYTYPSYGQPADDACALGSGPRYMICVTLFCVARIARETRAILACQRVFLLAQRAKTCDKI